MLTQTFNFKYLGNGLASRSLSESDLSEMEVGAATLKRAADNINARAAAEAANSAAVTENNHARNGGE